jgi:hypothetical protein
MGQKKPEGHRMSWLGPMGHRSFEMELDRKQNHWQGLRKMKMELMGNRKKLKERTMGHRMS